MAISLKKGEKAQRLIEKADPASSSKTGSFAEQLSSLHRSFVRPVKSREMIFFNSQLSLMLEIGTPLNDALGALRDQIQNPALKETIQAMIQDIEEGLQLSDAMKRHPRIFDTVYISMIRAGETGGFFNETLNRIVEMQEKRLALITQLRSALTYPAVLCIISLLVVVFALVGILPKFARFFEGKEHILPITTRFLMAMSASLQGYWWAYLIGAAGLVIGFRFFKQSEPGQVLTDRFLVSAPMLARLFNKIYTCQMLRTLGNLMESQVPILEALGVTRATIRNRYFRKFIERIVAHVEHGGRFSEPFAAYPYIMDTVKQMVTTGDEAGNLPPVMLRLAEFYDTEVEQELKTLSSIIEPLGLIVMGAIIGMIVASVILPMFRLAGALH
jgi:type II secretory pathway component PulF